MNKSDVWVVKLPQRSQWSEDVQAMTTKILGVYVVNLGFAINVCEMTPSYELNFIDYQFEPTDAVYGDEDLKDELDNYMRDGRLEADEILYVHVKELDELLKNRIKEGQMPDNGGGYPFYGDEEGQTKSAKWAGVLDEVRERFYTSTI